MAVNRSSPFFSGQLYEGWTVLSLAPGVYSFFRQDVQDGTIYQYLLPLPVHAFRSFSATIKTSTGELGTPDEFMCELYREIPGSDRWSLLSCAISTHERGITRLFTEGNLALSAGRYTARVTGKPGEILYLEFVADFTDDPAGGGNLHTLQDGREGGLYAIGDYVYDCRIRLDELIALAGQDVWQVSDRAENDMVVVTQGGIGGKTNYVLGYQAGYYKISDDTHHVSDVLGEITSEGATILHIRGDQIYHSCLPGIPIEIGKPMTAILRASGLADIAGEILIVGVTR
ncbi:hypothetical protein ES708_26811 [subsurface metagenome]